MEDGGKGASQLFASAELILSIALCLKERLIRRRRNNTSYAPVSAPAGNLSKDGSREL
jgi:hypothetical protein